MRKRIPSRFFHIRRAIALLLPAATLALIISSRPLQAQFLSKPINLAYLAQRADVIVQGKVTDVLNERLPGYPNIPTIKVTLNVESMVRGPAAATYTFREIILGLRPREDKRSYKVGQQLFLFMLTPSQYGLSSPIGDEQGRFRITRNPKGNLTVINGNNNEGMFTNVELAASKAGRKLTRSQSRVAATRRGPVQLDEFVSLVKSLTSLPRIR